MGLAVTYTSTNGRRPYLWKLSIFLTTSSLVMFSEGFIIGQPPNWLFTNCISWLTPFKSMLALQFRQKIVVNTKNTHLTSLNTFIHARAVVTFGVLDRSYVAWQNRLRKCLYKNLNPIKKQVAKKIKTFSISSPDNE